MAFLLEPRNRIVIPRWRSFERGFDNDEIIILKQNKITSTLDISTLSDKIKDWKNNPNISNALELVNSAFSLGENHDAIDAAEFLLANKGSLSHPLKLIIDQILDKQEVIQKPLGTQFLLHNFLKKSGTHVHELRAKLKDNPNNPLLWSSLARNYSILGEVDKAKKAIEIALNLTRNSNTYIQRIASRFYYHLNEIDRALHLVRKSKNHEVDPWLISSDIAYSMKLGRLNKYYSLGLKMLESDRFSNFDLTELASSLGTIQLREGSIKQARKSFDISLKDPNENSLAQVEFANSQYPLLAEKEYKSFLNTLPNAYEARSHEFNSESKFDLAFENGCLWLLDQPFSKRAALFTQHLAISKLERYDKGIEIGQFALRSNPNSFEIYNNITYAYAMKGELSKAKVNLERMKSLTLNQYHKIFMFATEGLVRLREDNLIDGKKLYDAAIELAIAEGQPHLKDLAIYNYLKEIYRATGNLDYEYISRFEKSSNLVKELNEQIKKLNN